MKLIVDRSSLLESLNTVSGIIPSRSPSPILTCLKIVGSKVAGAGLLTISGTDHEVSITLSQTKVDVVQPGQAVVNADKFKALVSTIEDTDSTVTIELDGDQLMIRSTRSRFRLFALPVSEYPPIPDAEQVLNQQPGPKTVFTIQSALLNRLIGRTIFATAKETSRYAFNGVLLKRDGKKLELVATDGRRMAMARSALKSADGAAGAAVSAILPTKALNLVTRVSKNPDEQIKVAILENRAVFSFEEEGSKAPRATVTTTLVEGAFPDYEKVIPVGYNKKISAATSELARAVRQASILTNEESRGVRLNFSVEDRTLRLSSRAPELGDSEIEMPLTGYEGENIEISFNPVFITEALKTVDEPEVLIELKSSTMSGLFKVGTEFLYVVMPVNLPS
jgi:DNA polymerase III subunit beta